jgi:hypothetical protein
MSVLGLSRREAWWKDAEILMLRHQLAVALRERPRVHSRLTWPDRAWLALLAGMLPADRLAAMRLIVTPAKIIKRRQHWPWSRTSWTITLVFRSPVALRCPVPTAPCAVPKPCAWSDLVLYARRSC